MEGEGRTGDWDFLSYSPGHLPTAQKTGSTQPLACSKHSVASSPLSPNVEAVLVVGRGRCGIPAFPLAVWLWENDLTSNP